MNRFRRSARAFHRAQGYLAGGVSSSMRASAEPVPLFFHAASGVKLTDFDGRHYLDYALAWGPLILGHSHPTILRAVRRQLESFQLLGAQHELEIEVARRICQIIPCAELVAFSNTGTEAVQLALRLARASSGRQKFVKFEGHYHGWMDNVLISYHPRGQDSPCGQPIAASGGQSRSTLQDVYVLPWNDAPALEATIEEHHQEIAAVITEPILCNSSCLMPCRGYLSTMRKLTERYGIVLIFDEVITGLRVALGGAQSLFGITPDLTVLGKALAAGFTLSAVVGKRKIMDLIAQRRVVHAGTFNGNPISLAAAASALKVLSDGRGRVLEKTRKVGQQLMSGIAQLAAEADIPCLINGVGTAFHLSFTSRTEMRDYRDTLDCNLSARDQFIQSMLEHGVYLLPDGRWYVSAAHTQANVEVTLQAVRKAFRRLRDLRIASVSVKPS